MRINVLSLQIGYCYKRRRGKEIVVGIQKFLLYFFIVSFLVFVVVFSKNNYLDIQLLCDWKEIMILIIGGVFQLVCLFLFYMFIFIEQLE